MRYSCCFHPVSYMINSLPHLITPTLTGRSTVGMLLSGLLLPGTKVRSGMNDPNGTFMKRLLSISQTEQSGACASADVTDATASPASATRVDANRRTRNPSVVIAFSLLSRSEAERASRKVRFFGPPPCGHSLSDRRAGTLVPARVRDGGQRRIVRCSTSWPSCRLLSALQPDSFRPEQALVRFVLSRPKHLANAQQVLGCLQAHALCVEEVLVLSVLHELQHLVAGICVESHGFGVLAVHLRQ